MARSLDWYSGKRGDILSNEATVAGCAAGVGAEKLSSIPRRSTIGAGAAGFAEVGVGAVVADRRGTGDDVDPETFNEFDLRTTEVSSSPASYSSYVFLESRNPPLLLPPPPLL